jgi:hypothetical protein
MFMFKTNKAKNMIFNYKNLLPTPKKITTAFKSKAACYIVAVGVVWGNMEQFFSMMIKRLLFFKGKNQSTA